MKPRYTDSKRYPNGYRTSHDTDVSRTFERERKRLADIKAEHAENEREAIAKVAAHIQPKKAAHG